MVLLGTSLLHNSLTPLSLASMRTHTYMRTQALVYIPCPLTASVTSFKANGAASHSAHYRTDMSVALQKEKSRRLLKYDLKQTTDGTKNKSMGVQQQKRDLKLRILFFSSLFMCSLLLMSRGKCTETPTCLI